MRTLPTYIPSPPQGVWHLGPVPIRAYALCIIAGIVAALVLTDRRWAARGGERGVVYDIALWAVPFGLIGGRLYHLATDWRTYFGDGGVGLAAALRIWDGGLGIWGAVALGGVGAWIACRRREIPLPAFADALAPGLILAQAIGRLGNYFNQELYGRRTSAAWGLEIFYRRDPTGFEDVHSLDGVSTGQLYAIVQPTFLYELLWNLLVFAALIYLDRKFKLGHGRLFATYVAGYCVGRFVVELLRDDTATHIAGIRINSFTSTFVFIGAVVYIILAPKGREDPDSLPSGEDEHAADVADAADVVDVVEGAPEPESEPEVAEAGVPGLAAAEPDEAEPDEDEAEDAEAEPESVEPEASEADADEEAEAEESAPEDTEAEPEDPDAAEAEAAVLEDSAKTSDVADDQAVEQDVADAAVELAADEPVAAELEAEEPATDESEADKPEVDEPEVDEPEVEESEVEESESQDSDAEVPEVGQADESDEEQVEAYSAEEAEEAEAEDPESEDSEAEDPAADEPEADEPEVDEPAAEPEAPEADEPEPAETADADRAPTDEAAPEAAPKRWNLRRRKQR